MTPGTRPAPRGSVIMVALVLIVLVAAMLTAMVRLSMVTRQRLQLDERLAQAEWLAASGLERAAARLRAEPAYEGETWDIPDSALGGRATAVVTIIVEPASDATGRRATARAELRLPPGEVVRRTRSALVGGEAARPVATDPNDNPDTPTRTGPDAAPEED